MLSIIIPTLNEKDVILNTISEIQEKIKGIKHEILVVDENSPDLTWKVIEDAKIPNVRCIRRMTGGSLSSAVTLGFSKAKGEYLLVTDGDSQHDPKIIPQMLEYIEDYDFVTGSRFIKGGGVKNWSKKRLFMSKTASFIARPLLSSKVNDPMSGFFMVKKKTFLELDKYLTKKGYKIFLEMIFSYEKLHKKAKIKEVPYHFRTRKQGESKLGVKVIFSYLEMLLIFFFRKNEKLIKFLIVGTSGIFVNSFILWFLTDLFLLYYLFSAIIATEVSILTNFLLNNFWTWEKNKNQFSFIKRLFSYNLVALGGLLISVITLFVLTDVFNMYYLISNLFGILLATFWNYIINDKITFKIKN